MDSFKVEYLIINDGSSLKCKNKESFNNLLKTDPDITINGKKLIYKETEADYELRTDSVSDTNVSYFHLKFIYHHEDTLEQFSSLLKAVRSTFSVITKAPQKLWDDLNLYYSQQAYPLIFDIENLMRKLITKFMLINVGMNWTKEALPVDVESSKNPNNIDTTFLHNFDFIHLTSFLFSENFPTHKENLIKKLKTATSSSDLDIEEIKKLIPQSNWEKYFKEKLTFDTDQLKKRWEKIYILRNRVAHNKDFSKTNLDEIREHHTAIKQILERAINELDSIDLEVEDKEELKIEIFETPSNYKVSNSLADFFHVLNKINNSELNNLEFRNKLVDNLSLYNRMNNEKDIYSLLFRTPTK